LIWWLYSRQFEDTDDATVDGHISAIAARIASPVIGVYTDENAYVKTGQLLADLDPKDFEVAVEQAQGQLLQAQGQSRAELPNVPVTQVTNQTEIAVANSAVSAAEAGVAAAEKNYEAALQKVRESEANNSKAQADVERYRPLAAKDEVPQEQFAQVQANAQSLAASVSADQANARAVERQVQQAREQLSQAQTRAAEALENAPRQLAIRRANVASREAGMEAAQAALDQARLNLSYCKVVSPVEGVVAKRIAEVGQHVAPGQQLFLISQINDLWVTANFRETQLRLMRAGQSVRIHVDAIDKDFDGYVESMPAASGAVTSLLPPENATGNFVKVVQRLPVRIRFKPNQQGLERLRPGMSVEPKVRVR
jgi:membrane fusion protein (multidrug efflux system)